MPRRPIVWIVNHYAATPDQGAGTRHYDLGRQLVERGFEPTIFAAAFSHFSRKDARLSGIRLWRSESIDGLTFVWIKSLSYEGNGPRRVLNMLIFSVLFFAAQVTRRGPEVIVGSTVHPLAAWTAMLVARLRRRPFVYEVRDLWPQTLVDMGAVRSTSIVARWLWQIEAKLVRGAVAVITVLPGMDDYLAQRGLPTRHVHYVPNGADLDRDRSGSIPDEIRVEIDAWRDEGRFVLAYVGSLGRANALSTVVDAVKELDGRAGLMIVGDGPERRRLESRAAGWDEMRVCGPVPKHSVGPLLHHVDAGVFHLADSDVFRYGISSNKLFDYMASGLPVLFACRTSYDPVTLAGAGISVAPQDVASMADAIRRLASLPQQELRAMGERGREYVRTHHSVDRLGDQLADILESVIGRA